MEESTWHIQFFGGFRALRKERLLTHFRTQKTAELLAYLAYYLQRTHPREELIELLWPEVDPVVGRNRLKQTLALLRRELEPPGTPSGVVLIADRANVRLNPAVISTDVMQFETALHAAAGVADPVEKVGYLQTAVALYRGELLPGYYQNWVQPERQIQVDAYVDALRQLALALEQIGDHDRALLYARRVMSIDPMQEEAHQDLMRLYARTGQPSAVLRQYKQLERVLQEQFGEEPSELTRRLTEKWRKEAEEAVESRAESSVAFAPMPAFISQPEAQPAPQEETPLAASHTSSPVKTEGEKGRRGEGENKQSVPSLYDEEAAKTAPSLYDGEGQGEVYVTPSPLLPFSPSPSISRWRLLLSALAPPRREAWRLALVLGLLPVIAMSGRYALDSLRHTNVPILKPNQDLIAIICNRNGKSDVCTVRLDGSDLRYLTDPNANDRDPAWSPDRTRIAFTSDRDGNDEIYVMDADGSHLRRLTRHPARDSNPSWTSDGSKIAFVSNRDGENKIYIMNADGSNQLPLTNNTTAMLR